MSVKRRSSPVPAEKNVRGRVFQATFYLCYFLEHVGVRLPDWPSEIAYAKSKLS